MVITERGREASRKALGSVGLGHQRARSHG